MNTDLTEITPLFDVVQRSLFSGEVYTKSPLKNLKYYLFLYKDGINVGNEIDESDLEFWRINANMEILAICDNPYILSKDRSEPEWQKIIQK